MRFPRFQRLGLFSLTASLSLFAAPTMLKSCVPPAQPATVAVSVTVGAPQPVTAELVALVNNERTSRGLAPVAVNDMLTRAAEAHSTEQATRSTMTHTGANGSSPGDRIAAQGYSASAWAENVAAGQPDCGSVMGAWMNSAGHRTNILNPGLQEIGVAVVAKADGTRYWTMDLATRG